MLTYLPNAGPSLAGIQTASVQLAYSAGALGIVFSGAILFITRVRLDSELRVYKLTGLPVTSALRLMLVSHPTVPLAWAVVAGTLSGLIDLYLGLDAYIPVGLAIAFSALLLAWLVLLTFRRFSGRDLKPGRRGRAG